MSERGILFKKNKHLDLLAFTYVDWAGDKDKRKSTSGYLTFVGENFVTWRSKKQKVLTLSSTEAFNEALNKLMFKILPLNLRWSVEKSLVS